MLNLHLGCGPIKLAGFVNVDNSDHWKPDVCEDVLDYLARQLNGSVDNIFSCHMVEHLEYPDEVGMFFKLCYRALNQGGVLRVLVPDLRKVAKAYLDGQDLSKIHVGGPFYYGKDMAADRFTYFMREWEHKIVFDAKLLGSFFRDAGFSPYPAAFNISHSDQMMNLDRYEAESLCMEAIR
jgi:predicted SAM-dependent methyltransferase